MWYSATASDGSAFSASPNERRASAPLAIPIDLELWYSTSPESVRAPG